MKTNYTKHLDHITEKLAVKLLRGYCEKITIHKYLLCRNKKARIYVRIDEKDECYFSSLCKFHARRWSNTFTADTLNKLSVQDVFYIRAKFNL